MRVIKELFKFQLKSDCPDVETATRAGHYMASLYGFILKSRRSENLKMQYYPPRLLSVM